MLRYLPLLVLPLFAQFGIPRWSVKGVGNTASRPATCAASKDAYINTQTSSIDYCTAANTWTALGGGGSGTVTSVDAANGVETVSGSAITSTGTVRAGITVNAQTGTTYTVLTGDRAKLVTHTNGSSIAVTLPQAGGTFPAGWFYYTQNRGAGTATITPTTSTIDGAASLALTTGQGAIIASDGTNYFTMRGLGTATGLGDPGSNSIVYRNGSGTSAPATATEMAGPLYCADAGANDTYTCTLSPAPSAYTTGATYIFKANTANTGAATINFNSLGAKTIKKVAGGITTDLADNDIRSGQFVELVYDGTNMQMQSTLGNAASGGGSSLTYGAYGSLPATCTTGDRYLTSDSLYEFACTATNTWTAFLFGRKGAVPPTAGWSWVNQSSATLTTTVGAQYMYDLENAEGYHLRCRTAPATPYTITAYAEIDSTPETGKYPQAGIAIRDSGTGKMVTSSVYPSQSTAYFWYTSAEKWTNATTFSSATAGAVKMAPPKWFRVSDNGTTTVYSWSPDGENWVTLLSEGRTTFMATPDQVCWGVRTNSSSSQPVYMSLLSWDAT